MYMFSLITASSSSELSQNGQKSAEQVEAEDASREEEEERS